MKNPKIYFVMNLICFLKPVRCSLEFYDCFIVSLLSKVISESQCKNCCKKDQVLL